MTSHTIIHHRGTPAREYVRIGVEVPYLRVWSLRPPVPVMKAKRKGSLLPKVSSK